jgi:hypothetical protein
MRAMHVEQLSRLLMVVQDMAHRLADESHGRSYDKVREFNELLHLARQQLGAIQADLGASAELPYAIERRRAPRSQFGDLI